MLKKSALCLCGIWGDVLVGWFTMICLVVLTFFFMQIWKKNSNGGFVSFFLCTFAF